MQVEVFIVFRRPWSCAVRVEDRWFQGREAEGAEDLGWGSEKEPERLVCVKMCTKGGGRVARVPP